MNLFRLLIDELVYRKTGFLLGIIAVGAAGALLVGGPTIIDAYRRSSESQLAALEAKNKAELDRLADETRKLMRDMGFNLMIVHSETNMADFWADDFAKADMPEEYVQRLANATNITLATHLVATLQQKIEWNGRKVLLVGYLPETAQAHRAKKKPMGYVVEPGTVYLGHELARGRAVGETTEVLGRSFRIARILREQGSKEDITIAMALKDAQAITEKPGRVNQILALGCRCAGERLPKVRAQLAEVLPDTQITEFRSIALARAEQRDLVEEQSRVLEADLADNRAKGQQKLERLAAVTTPLAVLVAAIFVGLLALGNARERRSEVGILRALGVSSRRIGSLFLAKAALQGGVGGLVGFVVGDALARTTGGLFEIAPEQFATATDVAIGTVVGAPIVTMLASYIPILIASAEDPAKILREA